MIIAFRTRCSIDRILGISLWAIASGTLILGVLFSMVLVRPRNIEVEPSSMRQGKGFKVHQILTGPLSLYESHRSALAITLEQKLVLLAQSLRPDLLSGEQAFRIGIRGADQQKVVKEGEAIFFDLTKHVSGGVEKIEFAPKAEGTCAIPHVQDGKSLILKIEGEEVVLQACNQKQSALIEESEIDDLAKATWWGQDLLFRSYGGVEYGSLGQKHKIEIKTKGRSYLLFVSSKDYLSYKGKEWHVLSSLKGSDRTVPLAQVREVSSNQLEIEIWDKEGFSICQRTLSQEKKQPVQGSADQLIAQPKLRSAKQISCKIGKKRMLLKPGDWLIKTQTGWHKLAAIEEIEAYLTHQLRGELLVIDSIDTHGKVRGHYFDQMRTQMQSFMIQAVSSKKKTKKKAGLTKK